MFVRAANEIFAMDISFMIFLPQFHSDICGLDAQSFHNLEMYSCAMILNISRKVLVQRQSFLKFWPTHQSLFGLKSFGVSADILDVDLWGVLGVSVTEVCSSSDFVNGTCLRAFLNHLVSTCALDTILAPRSPIT